MTLFPYTTLFRSHYHSKVQNQLSFCSGSITGDWYRTKISSLSFHIQFPYALIARSVSNQLLLKKTIYHKQNLGTRSVSNFSIDLSQLLNQIFRKSKALNLKQKSNNFQATKVRKSVDAFKKEGRHRTLTLAAR